MSGSALSDHNLPLGDRVQRVRGLIVAAYRFVENREADLVRRFVFRGPVVADPGNHAHTLEGDAADAPLSDHTAHPRLVRADTYTVDGHVEPGSGKAAVGQFARHAAVGQLGGDKREVCMGTGLPALRITDIRAAHVHLMNDLPVHRQSTPQPHASTYRLSLEPHCATGLFCPPFLRLFACSSVATMLPLGTGTQRGPTKGCPVQPTLEPTRPHGPLLPALARK